MTGFNQIERSRRTAIYISISTSQQQTDRQETEVVRRIFDLFIDGKSSYDIVTILSAEAASLLQCVNTAGRTSAPGRCRQKGVRVSASSERMC